MSPSAETELAPKPEEGREKHAFDDLPRVGIHPAAEARIARRVCRRHLAQVERSAVREDDPLPDQQRTSLPVGPGDRSHGRAGRALKHQQVNPAIGRDHEIRAKPGRGRLDENVGPPGGARPAGRVADHPSRSVAGSNRDQAFPRLQGNVADQLGRCEQPDWNRRKRHFGSGYGSSLEARYCCGR